jgi:hypothetical protein
MIRIGLGRSQLRVFYKIGAPDAFESAVCELSIEWMAS